MSDLNIPNLNKKSEKYIFKNKLTLRRKSKKKLLIESTAMLLLSSLLIYLVYLVPNKNSLFRSFFSSLDKLFKVTLEFLSYFYQILVVIFLVLLIIAALILFVGAIYRLHRVLKRKTSKILFK